MFCFSTHPSNLLNKLSAQQCQVSGSKSLLLRCPRQIHLHTGGFIKLKQGFCEDNDEHYMRGCVHAGASPSIGKRALVSPCTFLKEVRSRLRPSHPLPLPSREDCFSHLQLLSACVKISKHEMTPRPRDL